MKFEIDHRAVWALCLVWAATFVGLTIAGY
jgi:hypothetical protein